MTPAEASCSAAVTAAARVMEHKAVRAAGCRLPALMMAKPRDCAHMRCGLPALMMALPMDCARLRRMQQRHAAWDGVP